MASGPERRGLAALVGAFAGTRVLVVGDCLLDRYLVGHVTGVCREGPVPVVALDTAVDLPGGAGNTAANLRALGADVTLLCPLGDDRDARDLAEALSARGVTLAPPRSPAWQTVTKHRLSAGEQLLARYDTAGRSALPPTLESELLTALEEGWDRADVVVVADYAYGACSDRLLQVVGRLQAARPRLLVVDARDPRRHVALGATAVKPNFSEAMLLLDRDEAAEPADRGSTVEQAAEQLLAAAGAGTVVVTLDVDGAVVLEHGRTVHRVAARPTPARRAAGGGDTFTAALSLALAAGADSANAAELASAAAAVAVAKPHTAVCEASELLVSLEGASKRLSGPGALALHLEAYRRRGERIVFTNGCFDLLHRGHVAYLNRAKLLGDVLVVAVNADDSVRRLKGPGRPVNPLEDRLQVLAALGCVDHVVAFDGDSPTELLRAARPNVYVKGGDYTPEMLPEAALVEELGGRVQILGYVEDRSTSRIIDLIRDPAPTS